MSNETTILSDLIFNELEKETETLSHDNLSKSIVDMSLSLETRIKAIDMYYQQEGGDNTIETINKLATIYEMSGTKLLRQYLFAICEKSTIEPFLQSLAARALHAFNNQDELGYKAIDIVYPKLGMEIGTPYKIEFVKMLMQSDSYRQKSRDYFCEIINNLQLDCDYRYKIILGFEYKPVEDEKYNHEQNERILYFITEANLCFIKNKENKIRYRILAGQYLLQKCDIGNNREIIEKIILSFAEDEKLDYNTRADATDVLLQLASPEIKKIAQKIILNLGSGNKNIYENTQNVHTKSVEDSVLQALEFLQSFDLGHRGETLWHSLQVFDNCIDIFF